MGQLVPVRGKFTFGRIVQRTAAGYRFGWAQGIERPTDTPPVPDTLDWDLWLGPAPYRPYNPAYVPFKWRGWWDFGSGGLGDMGIHNLAPVFSALKLGAPESNPSQSPHRRLSGQRYGRCAGAI